jgi:hypothetical protein
MADMLGAVGGWRLLDCCSVIGGSTPACLSFSQHAYQHRPKGPALLAVDQELGEGAGGRVPPVRANPLGAVEGRVHQDAQQPGARAPGVETARGRRPRSSGRLRVSVAIRAVTT